MNICEQLLNFESKFIKIHLKLFLMPRCTYTKADYKVFVAFCCHTEPQLASYAGVNLLCPRSSLDVGTSELNGYGTLYTAQTLRWFYNFSANGKSL